MSPRFTQNAQGGGESALIPVTPRRGSNFKCDGAREEERHRRSSYKRPQGGGERALDTVGPLGPNLVATTPGRRRGAVAIFKRSREEERSSLSSVDRSGPVFATTTPGRRRGIVAVVEGLREERPSEFLCLAACLDRQAADHGAAQTQVGQFAVRKLVQLIVRRAIHAVLTEAFCCVCEKDRKARGFRCGHRRCACYICHCHFSQSARVSVRCCVSDIAVCCTCTIAALAKQPCAQRIADVTSR